MSQRKLRRSVARAEAIRKGTGVLVTYRPRGPSKRGGWMVPPGSGWVSYHLPRKKLRPKADGVRVEGDLIIEGAS